MVNAIAIVGSDGAGKSTLATALCARLRPDQRAEFIYLGQSSGKIAAWIRGWPLVGAACARYLVRKAARSHAREAAPIGNVTALVIYLLSRWRCHKFRRMLARCRSGALMVTDRYPQAEIPGFDFDGPELATQHARNGWVRRLGVHEQHLYQWMATHVPLLVIRLGVDAATAHARKPDHKRAVLEAKVATLPRLTFNGARIIDLDGCAPAAQVLDAALVAVRAALEAPPA